MKVPWGQVGEVCSFSRKVATKAYFTHKERIASNLRRKVEVKLFRSLIRNQRQ